MLGSRALTKLQALILVAIIVVVSVVGVAAYVFWIEASESGDTIKIGILGDIDLTFGRSALQGATLAAEEINAAGGVLGKNIEIIGEDSDGDSGSGDINTGINALTRLITYDKVDYLLTTDVGTYVLPYQDLVAQHNKILIGVRAADDELTERITYDYEKYKYFFRIYFPNATSSKKTSVNSFLTLRDLTGFNKIGYLFENIPIFDDIANSFDYYLSEIYGFDIVYKGKFPPGTVDFTSYLAAAEAAEIEILWPGIATEAGFPFIKEWYERQSPFVLWGVIGVAQDYDFWNLTDGKCEHLSIVGVPVTAGYPLTNKTLPLREAYIERWGEIPDAFGSASYDAVRFILFEAIERAGTIETDAVVSALERTDVMTSLARRFVFTSSHDVFVGEGSEDKPEEQYLLVGMFQWQDGKMVPVYPKSLMEEAGATLTFPNWPGPWDNLD